MEQSKQNRTQRDTHKDTHRDRDTHTHTQRPLGDRILKKLLINLIQIKKDTLSQKTNNNNNIAFCPKQVGVG
jgi:hypothetical protein